MDIYGEMVRHVIHPTWKFKDGKYKLFKYLDEFEKSQYLSCDELRKHQFIHLKKLLNHAYASCTYYKDLFDKIGINPNDVKDFSDYCKIPVLTKNNIQGNLDDLTSKYYMMEELLPNKTGGSTGKPIHYYHDKERDISMEASTIRHDRWAGYDIGDKLAVIWGHRSDVSVAKNMKGRFRDIILNRKRFLDASSISEEAMENYVMVLRQFRPKHVLAYANAMYLFAKYCKENSISDIRPVSIITSAEVLEEEEKSYIEEVFACKVFNRYGCREVSVVASECEAHSGLHICAETLYVEFVKSDGSPARPGELGEIVITDLFNYGMPFIRYKIEDMGVMGNSSCPCGRGLPLMEMVGGRVTDFLETMEGVKVSGASVTIYLISNVPGIRQAQFVQDRKDLIKLKIVRGEKFDEQSVSYLNKKIPEFFGNITKVEYEYVDDIPREPSGKYLFSICRIGR